MKKIIMPFLAVLTVGLSAMYFTEYAVSGSGNVSSLTGLGMHAEVAATVDQLFGSAIRENILPYSLTPTLNPNIGSATKPFKNIFLSSDTTYTANGAGPKFPAASVITPDTAYPTPNAGSTLLNRVTILAAGAPTAAFVNLPATAAVVGEEYKIYNQGSNPLAIVPQPLSLINVSAAATPFSCTTLKECNCVALSTTTWGCSQQ